MDTTNDNCSKNYLDWMFVKSMANKHSLKLYAFKNLL